MTNRNPKRPPPPASLDTFLRASGHSPLSSSSSSFSGHKDKKPRFDVRNPSTLAPDLEDDITNDNDHTNILDLDEIGAGGRRVKRNAVNIEGYESDSSNEGYERRRVVPKNEGEKKRVRKEDDGDGDDDMFAGGNDEDEDGSGGEGGGRRKAAAGGGGRDKKKGVRFLELDEIEGQELGSEDSLSSPDDDSEGDDDEDEDEDEDEDDGDGDGDGDGKNGANGDKKMKDGDAEDVDEVLDEEEVGAGGRKKNAPKIDAFNMKSEMEEGRFDEAGNFIRKAKDVDAVHDSWLEGVSRKDIRKAREAMERREKERVEKMKADDRILTADVLRDLITCLERGETPIEALARLGGGKKKKKWNGNKNTRWKKKGQDPSQMDVDAKGDNERVGEDETEEEMADRKRKEMVERITGAADILLTRGQTEIYEDTREMLMRQYKRETGEDWEDPRPPAEGETEEIEGKGKKPVQPSEAKWEYRWMDSEDDKIYGPFGGADMAAWNAHGFFGSGVEFRKVGTSKWTMVADFDE